MSLNQIGVGFIVCVTTSFIQSLWSRCPDCVCPTCPTCPSCPGAAATPPTPITRPALQGDGSWWNFSWAWIIVGVALLGRYWKFVWHLGVLWFGVDVLSQAEDHDNVRRSRRRTSRALEDEHSGSGMRPGTPLGMGALQRSRSGSANVAPAVRTWAGGILGDVDSE